MEQPRRLKGRRYALARSLNSETAVGEHLAQERDKEAAAREELTCPVEKGGNFSSDEQSKNPGDTTAPPMRSRIYR